MAATSGLSGINSGHIGNNNSSTGFAPPPPSPNPTYQSHMLNLNILEYLKKMGYKNAMAGLETDLPELTQKQVAGSTNLLWEWWHVFWDIYDARSKKSSSQSAQSYVDKQRTMRLHVNGATQQNTIVHGYSSPSSNQLQPQLPKHVQPNPAMSYYTPRNISGQNIPVQPFQSAMARQNILNPAFPMPDSKPAFYAQNPQMAAPTSSTSTATTTAASVSKMHPNPYSSHPSQSPQMYPQLPTKSPYPPTYPSPGGAVQLMSSQPNLPPNQFQLVPNTSLPSTPYSPASLAPSPVSTPNESATTSQTTSRRGSKAAESKPKVTAGAKKSAQKQKETTPPPTTTTTTSATTAAANNIKAETTQSTQNGSVPVNGNSATNKTSSPPATHNEMANMQQTFLVNEVAPNSMIPNGMPPTGMMFPPQNRSSSLPHKPFNPSSTTPQFTPNPLTYPSGYQTTHLGHAHYQNYQQGISQTFDSRSMQLNEQVPFNSNSHGFHSSGFLPNNYQNSMNSYHPGTSSDALSSLYDDSEQPQSSEVESMDYSSNLAEQQYYSSNPSKPSSVGENSELSEESTEGTGQSNVKKRKASQVSGGLEEAKHNSSNSSSPALKSYANANMHHGGVTAQQYKQQPNHHQQEHYHQQEHEMNNQDAGSMMDCSVSTYGSGGVQPSSVDVSCSKSQSGRSSSPIPDFKASAESLLEGFEDSETAPASEAMDITLLRGMVSHVSKVLTCSFDSSGRYLATGGGGSDSSIRVWNTETGNLHCSLSGHSHNITSLKFSPDPLNPLLLLSCAMDGTIRFWDCSMENQGKELFVMKHSQPVQSLDWHPTSHLKFIISDNLSQMSVWEIPTPFGEAPTSPYAVMSKTANKQIKFSPSGRYVSAGLYSNNSSIVKIIDLECLKVVQELAGHEKQILCLHWIDESLLLTVSEDSVKVWKIGATVECLRSFSAPGDKTYCALPHPKHACRILIGAFQKIYDWDYVLDKHRHSVCHDGIVSSLASNNSGSVLASTSHDKLVRLWSLA